ncbi:MAG: Lacal_2735 family protein [Planctomycetota bacterium]
MFGLFASKTKKQQLEEKYSKLLAESHRLSTIDRMKSDLKAAEADAVLKEIDALGEE